MDLLDSDNWNNTTILKVNGLFDVTNIPDGMFQRFPYLTEAEISTKLTTISPDNFKHAKALNILKLDNNKIFYLWSNVFAELTQLKQLTLSFNRIETIEDFTFNGLNELEHLSLENNRLIEIKRNTFAGAPNLVTLDISSNGITSIAEGAIDFPNLNQLLLDKNPIAQLPAGFFNGVPKLQKFIMNNDQLKAIDPSLYDLKHLESLQMSNNANFEVDLGALLRMPALVGIRLERMNVRLPTNTSTAPEVSSLMDLRLNDNDIRSADIVNLLKAFNLRKLETIYLLFNGLCDVNGLENLHEHFPVLNHVELGDNPMECTIFDAIVKTLKAQSIDITKYGTACSSTPTIFCSNDNEQSQFE